MPVSPCSWHPGRLLGVFLVLALEAPLALAADAPSLMLPVACEVGETCFVQNYPDADAGPGYKDYACGRLSYDGHQGTDFRVATLAQMRAGIAVRAAAPGVVRAVREGMPDISVRERGLASIEGRDAGNAVAIRHGNGWETQYSHLRRGSVLVSPGDRVEGGAQIGLIGLSGRTEFPHLHFSVRRQGQVIDPFSGQPLGRGCEADGEPLWVSAVAEQLAYSPTALLNGGFAAVRPDARQLRDDPAALRRPDPARWPVLVFWVDLMGLQADDRLEMTLVAPGGDVLARANKQVGRDQAQHLMFIGKRRPDSTWPSGDYIGRFRLWREAPSGSDDPVLELERSFAVAGKAEGVAE
jgi:hypothetical protein